MTAAIADTQTETPTRAIAALALAAMVSGMALRVTDALLPRLASDFSISLGQAAQVVTAYAVAYGLAQLGFGPLGDRFGKYRVIAWACAGSAVTSLLCALAVGPHSLMAARLLAGASAGAVIPLSMAWIGDAVPYANRQPVLARFLTGQITGFAVGMWGGGYAAEHLDWRAPFFAIAALFAVASVVLHTLRRRGLTDLTQPPRQQVLRHMVGEFAGVLAKPWARAVLMTVFLEGALVFGPFVFVPAHLHDRFELPLSTVGGLMMAYAAGGLVFAFNARWLVQRLGERKLVQWGAITLALAFLLLAFGPWWSLAAPACAIVGVGFYMLHNTLQTQATQMASERRGSAVATFAACLFLGQSVGVAISAVLVEMLGTAWVLALGAMLLPVVAWQFNRWRDRLL